MQISTISFDGDMNLVGLSEGDAGFTQANHWRRCKGLIPTPRALKLTVDEMIEIRDQFAEEVKGEIWSLLEIRRRAFERTLEHVGHPDKDLAAHLDAIYRKHRFEDIELYPDVIPDL